MNQGILTTEQAVNLSKSEFWSKMDNYEIALFQLSFEQLCMPWEIFHEAVEKTLGREVYNDEFQNFNNLREELLGNKSTPTRAEILALIPSEDLFIFNQKEF
ncbi:MAG: hypothetical protein AAGF26_13485 [Cyanobacteria bacterium P01_G01_bin.49]